MTVIDIRLFHNRDENLPWLVGWNVITRVRIEPVMGLTIVLGPGLFLEQAHHQFSRTEDTSYSCLVVVQGACPLISILAHLTWMWYPPSIALAMHCSFIFSFHLWTGDVSSCECKKITSFTPTNVKLRLRFDVHLTFHWHLPEPHLTTLLSFDLPLTLTRPLPNLD